MHNAAKGGDHEPAAPAQRRNDAGLARTDALQPSAPDRRGRPEQHEEQRIHPAEARNAPVASRGEKLTDERDIRTGDTLVETDGARQRQPEHAEAIGHANAEMDAKGGRRHQPAIEPRLGNDAFPVEQPQRGPKAARLFDRRHCGFLRYGSYELCYAVSDSRFCVARSLLTASRTGGSRPTPPASRGAMMAARMRGAPNLARCSAAPPTALWGPDWRRTCRSDLAYSRACHSTWATRSLAIQRGGRAAHSTCPR